jgi:hypothetical protein
LLTSRLFPDHHIRRLDDGHGFVVGFQVQLVDSLVGDLSSDDYAVADIEPDMRCRLSFLHGRYAAPDLVSRAELHDIPPRIGHPIRIGGERESAA